MKIYIIRHAEPDYEHNTLTKNGFIEAEALGKYYKDTKFDAIYVSPLARARLTAHELYKYRDLKEDVRPWMEEFYHPIKKPETGEEIRNWDILPSYFSKFDEMYDNNKYLDSELMRSGDVKKYYDIVTKNFDEILKSHGYIRHGRTYDVVNGNEKTIVFVCHLCTMAVLMSHLLGIPYIIIAQNFACLPSGVTIINSEEREKGIVSFRMDRFSDISHLTKYNIPLSASGKFKETY